MCRPWSAKARMNGWVGQVSVDSPSVVQAPDGTDLFRQIKSGSLEDISSAPLNTAQVDILNLIILSVRNKKVDKF